MESYTVPKLAELLHKFPHLDFTFSRIDPSFAIGDQQYRQSLLLWASLPILWMLTTLLVLLLYFCYRCCRRDPVSTSQSSCCVNWALAVLGILCCAALVTAFFGNDDVRKGTDRVNAAQDDFHSTIDRTIVQLKTLEQQVLMELRAALDSLHAEWNTLTKERRLDEASISEHRVATSHATTALRELGDNLRSVRANVTQRDFSALDFYIREFAFYRWVACMVLLGTLLLILLLLLLGIGRSSRATLLIFCAFGILGMVVCWLIVGIHLATSVATGDFCVTPRTSFERATTNLYIEELDRYYSQCTEGMRNPFAPVLQSLTDNLRVTRSAYESSVAMLAKYKSHVVSRPAQFDVIIEPIFRLAAYLECSNLNKNYADAVEGLCYNSLPGVFMLTVATAVAGLLFPILVVLASGAWRYLGQKTFKPCSSSNCYEERGVFLPRQEPSSPTYPSYARSHGGGMSRESLPLTHRQPDDMHMPPPGYNTSMYYRQPGTRLGMQDASL